MQHGQLQGAFQAAAPGCVSFKAAAATSCIVVLFGAVLSCWHCRTLELSQLTAHGAACVTQRCTTMMHIIVHHSNINTPTKKKEVACLLLQVSLLAL